MTSTYVKFVIDPDGDNYTVPASDLIRARAVRNVNTPSAFEFTIHNPAGARNDLYEMDDKVDVYIDTSDPPTTKVMTGLLEEVEINRPEVGRNTLTSRGEDYLTVLAYRLGRSASQGVVNIGTVLVNLVTEYAAGEFTTTNVSGGVYTVTDFTVGTRTSLLNIMRKLAELPTGESYDFYIDGDNDIHWHLRGNAAYDSGETVDGDDIRAFSSRRSVKDKKTYIHIQGAHTPREETSQTQNTVTNSVTLETNHYADDFTAEHSYLPRVELYIQKIGNPGSDFTGRIAVAKHGDPTGDFEQFSLREEEVSTTAGWHPIPLDVDTMVGTRYFIKLDKVGADSSNTYKWYGDTPAVLDTENKALSSTNALKWDSADYDLSMKIFYGELVEVSASTATTPKREAVVTLSKSVPEDVAQALADRLLAVYLQTNWMASITADAPSAELKPGDLITLNETGSGLASKTYRMERIEWEFGARGKTETVTLDISSVLPYEELSEITSRILEELMGGGGKQLQSGDSEGAEPDRIGRSVVGRSLVGYEPS